MTIKEETKLEPDRLTNLRPLASLAHYTEYYSERAREDIGQITLSAYRLIAKLVSLIDSLPD